ncbi:ISL3 family transposase [Propioniciclava soli]|uniref:ISL3 family transposase n=1 Tax=Propioniciclava soli TaxID=2775081 RepID=UPI0022B779E4|nr:ISL3 family transposase [Propioniciclava soli]
MACAWHANTDDSCYCANCDLLVGLPGLHVVGVDRDDGGVLRVTVESAVPVMGCPACGVVAHSHGRRTVALVDTPAFGAPTKLLWRKRTWECIESSCPMGVFTEQDPAVAGERSVLTTRACVWAIGQMRREHASVAGLARQLGVAWNTVWTAIGPLLAAKAADESRFHGVTTLGVDEHLWHHVSPRKRGPKELTGMVDLTPDKDGNIHARLLDLVPGRSGTVYKTWLKARGKKFRAGVEVATLDPFRGYKNAIDDQLDDATAVLDAFHIVKLGTSMVDDVRRRVQQDTQGHRGRSGDPLYGIRNVLRAGVEHLTERQHARLAAAFDADERHLAVEVAWQCAQRLRAVYHQETPQAGRALAIKVVDGFASCPIPEVARLGRTLKQWKDAFLAYFDTDGASNGGCEAVNGLIELHRRIARGFRNRENYRLRMLLIAGGLDPSPPPQL